MAAASRSRSSPMRRFLQTVPRRRRIRPVAPRCADVFRRYTMLLGPRIAKTHLPPKRSKRRANRKYFRHLAFIRELECPIYPGERPIEAHHLLRADPRRGIGRKAADRYAIPLSRKAHSELHACGGEESWLAARGVDGRALAAALWRASGDIHQGLRIVARVAGSSRLKIGNQI